MRVSGDEYELVAIGLLRTRGALRFASLAESACFACPRQAGSSARPIRTAQAPLPYAFMPGQNWRGQSGGSPPTYSGALVRRLVSGSRVPASKWLFGTQWSNGVVKMGTAFPPMNRESPIPPHQLSDDEQVVLYRVRDGAHFPGAYLLASQLPATTVTGGHSDLLDLAAGERDFEPSRLTPNRYAHSPEAGCHRPVAVPSRIGSINGLTIASASSTVLASSSRHLFAAAA